MSHIVSDRARTINVIRISLLCILCLSLMTPFSALSDARVIIYPRPEDGIDERQDFSLDVLQAILKPFSKKYDLKESAYPAQQDRALLLLNDKELDIVWTGSSMHREEHYRAIRIPIQKGLLGWRLFLVNQDRQDLLAKVHTPQQLRLFSVGLGGGWPDVALFSDNGFVVHTTTSYEALFRMLQKRRFDLFPRSVLEIWDELKNYEALDIAIEPRVAVHYPYANFFFVHKDDELLAQDIEIGFKKLIATGQYEVMFQKAYGDLLNKANLENRQLMSLSNGFFRKPDDKEKKYYFNL